MLAPNVTRYFKGKGSEEEKESVCYTARDLKSLLSAHRESKREKAPLKEMHYKYC